MTLLLYVALLVGLLGLWAAWQAHRKNDELKERIAQVNSRVYNLRREMQAAQEKAEHELMTLKFQVLKLQGDLQVTPEMKIREVAAIHPHALQLLAGFHLGGCSSCAVDDNQSLAEAAAINGRDLSPILVALNNLVTGSATGNGRINPDQLKTPNIQLHF